jgi:branched-chain amino acid transport system ATP-binding protein
VTALFALEGVTVAFGGVKALDDVNLVVEDDAGITGIIGPNGAGKSTCLSVIAGARKPKSGTVEVLGHSLRRADTAKVTRFGVARTFQIPRPFAEMTVRENILVAVTASTRLSSSAADEQTDEILSRVGLDAHAGELAGSLPLAVRKKIEVARGIAVRPRLLLLDEVFEGLSDTEIKDMVGILKDLDRAGIRLVLVEHVLRALRQLATTLVVFEKGQMIATGPVEEVLDSDRVKDAYLGHRNTP